MFKKRELQTKNLIEKNKNYFVLKSPLTVYKATKKLCLLIFYLILKFIQEICVFVKKKLLIIVFQCIYIENKKLEMCFKHSITYTLVTNQLINQFVNFVRKFVD